MSHLLPRLMCLLALVPLGATQAADQPPHYRITHQVPLPGDEGWDYLLYDQQGQRLFVSHGSRVLVVDGEKLSVTGEIPGTPGVHGIALAPDLDRGYISAGRAGSVVVFELKTLARLKEIKVTGENPDAILYDPATHRVLTFNGRGRNVTAIDAKTDEVVGTVAVDAKPEFAATDGKGRVYVNLEDRNSLAALDPQQVALLSTWPLPGCDKPSGLAIDAAHGRLFPVCGSKVMLVVDAASGKVLGSAPIGAGVDAAAYDPATRLAFASCGEGVLTVVRVDASGRPEVAESLATQRGARTMALDLEKHRVFLVTADVSPPPPATAEQPHPRPSIAPGSVRLLVLESGS